MTSENKFRSKPIDFISLKDEQFRAKEIKRQTVVMFHRKNKRHILKNQDDKFVFLGELHKSSTSKRLTFTATTFEHSSRPLTSKLQEEPA